MTPLIQFIAAALATVTAAAQAWRDNGCSDDRELYALVHAIDALTPESA